MKETGGFIELGSYIIASLDFVLASKGNRNRGNKRSRQETSSNVKNGGTKPKGSGQHKRFDNDDNDDVKEEKEEIKEDTNKEVNEGEPEAKKVKAE